jgi:hypothetical protein
MIALNFKPIIEGYMKNYLKIISFGLLFLAISLFFSIKKLNNFTQKETSLAINNTQETTLSYIKNLENQTWSELKRIGITQKMLSDAMEQYYDEFQATDLPPTEIIKVSPEIEALIKEVCNELSVNPESILIVSYDIKGPIASSDKIIFVNEKVFNAFSQDAQRFQIAHELNHIKHHDTQAKFSLEKILEQIGALSDYTSIFNKFCCLQENRADFETALMGKKWAEGFVTFTQEVVDMWGNTTDQTHSQNTERLALAKNILSNHQIA